jgi:predicted N-acetyltransferase YhbS
MITYQTENDLSVHEFKALLLSSSLGERRPVDEPERLENMLEHANLIVTARDHGQLIGVSRSLTDYAFCTYLSDLAVDEAYQKQGIGKQLIRFTKQAAPLAKLILLSAPAAQSYYPKIGMQAFEHCYTLDDVDDII